ncbi:MAG TPA: hypothetical protein DHW02_07195 [Ktedonobacter sp.]|nr:hypothetical protein [Ktedonobacter sp.]
MQEQQEYGAYSGSQSNQSYQPPYYDGPQQGQGIPSSPQNDMYDDAFIDSLSLRLSQRMAQGSIGKVNVGTQKPARATAGQRLALAIVSLGIFFVVTVSLVQSVSAILALIAIGLTALVCIAVNIIFNIFV